MNETETRLLIDEQLKKFGWNADSKNLRQSKGTRPQRGKNIAIAEWQTVNGFADYALFVGEKLVGLIEAKAIHTDISSVLDYQCKDYAQNIRRADKKYLIGTWNGFRVPFIFATNGREFIPQFETASGIWFLDLRDSANTPKALRGWISPEGILELLEKNIPSANENLQAMSKNFLTDEDGLNLREYQLKAVQAVESAVINGQKNILLAMATGTGKTRTILAMIYRFLKSGRFRRIFFLVDRNTLGEQAQDVFHEVKIEDLMTLDKIYNVAKLGENFDKETRVQVATVQSMVKRVLYNEENFILSPTDFDLIIVDEAHRGYILDKEISDGEENIFLNQQDYLSKYRRVIEYFDAVKIGLTATPALHTTKIFGAPIFKYGYREAVLDGFLVDYNTPHILKTFLSKFGIHYAPGDTVNIFQPSTGELKTELLDDELNFDVENFNRQVVNGNFNRAVLQEISKFINPDGAGKTLIFAVNDRHADLIAQILKNIFSDEAVMKITGNVYNGNKEKIQSAIRRFKNEKFPNIVVTVDLLTTGIDVPKIDKLVFLRCVKSRILFEQMLGRATRLCPEIAKTHFQIFDAVGVYETLEPVSGMKPVAVNPSVTFTELLEKLNVATDELQIENLIAQIIAKLQRSKVNFNSQTAEHFQNFTGGNSPQNFVSQVKNLTTADAKNFLLQHSALFKFLQEKSARPFIISDHEDFLLEHSRGYGGKNKPADYLDEFTDFLTTNQNEIAALNIICTRPKDLTRADLKALRLKLEVENFTAERLNAAISKISNAEITADIISLIRRFALGAQLLNHDDKIISAVNRLKAVHNFSANELKWISRIEKYLLNESLINVAIFDERDTYFKDNGGFKKINKVFGGNLAKIIDELNFYLYDDGGNAA